jgi:acetyl esterase/lipase
MTDPREAAIPAPLRDWLALLAEAKRRALECGYRPTVTNARESLDGMTRRYVTQAPELWMVRDDAIAGPDHQVPVRVYHPHPGRALPVALFVHGGGHVAGGVSLYDPIARKLAIASSRIVVSVEYRLAPECPYPAGLNDVMACAKRVFRCLGGLDLPYEPRLALVGDSGGGALCATVSHLGQWEPGLAIERQALIYPSLDYTLTQPSAVENGVGYLLERERILWMFDAYLQNAENRRSVSPLFMDLTDRYPPTLMVTAGFDPLRDEGVAYLGRLRGQGIRCEHLHLPGLVHAYLCLENLVPDQCARTYEAIGAFLGGD